MEELAKEHPVRDFVQQIDRFEQVDPEKEYQLLGMRSRIAGPFIRETKQGTEISANKLNKVKQGDFIYSRLFAWQGSFGLIPAEMDGCYVSNEFPIFKLDNEKIISEYLVYWFALPHIQKRVEADCSGSTPGTRNRYKEIFFLSIQLPLPSIDEQQTIVSNIQSVSKKINEAKRLRQEILDDAQAMLLSAFQQIIEGAEYQTMEKVAPIVRRKVEIEIDGEYPELGVRSFGKGTFHKPVLNGIDVGTKKLYHILPGDLVFSNVFAWEGAIAVVKKEDNNRTGSHRFITCIPKDKTTTSDFLCFYFLTNEGIEKIRDASPGGAGRNRTLGLKKLEQLTVPIPDYDKQIWFNALQTKVADIKKAQADNQTELDALLPAILDKAFKGELV